MFGTNFSASDGRRIRLWKWEAAQPQGTLLLIHGMAEHARRYDAFAVEMMRRGYSVWAMDLRGHGETAAAQERGDFGAGGYGRVLQDVREIRKQIQGPCVLMGHSMGSTLAQLVAQNDGEEYCGLILSGVALGDAKLRAIAPVFAKIVGFLTGEKRPSGFLDQLTFGNYNKPFQKQAGSRFAWISSIPEEERAYDKDPLCGFVCTADFFCQLGQMIQKALKKDRMARIPKDLPVEIFVGGNDPAGEYGAHGKLIHSLWTKAGLSVGLTVFPSARHDILHDEDGADMTDMIAECMQEWTA